MNIQFAQKTLQQLANLGVKTLCICPGARNAPFIEILSRQNYFEVLSFYDERSAGFFALGRARRQETPVAVFTTSGTAVSELLSSVIEAFYSNVPLIVVSSDRPKRLRGTGAPQTIDQTKIFNGHVEKIWDLEVQDSFELELSSNKPLHINICFDEPLVEGDLLNFSFNEPVAPVNKNFFENPIAESLILKKPLVVVGALSEGCRQDVIEFLIRQDCPIYFESLSGLRGDNCLKSKSLKTGERIVSEILKSGDVDSVLRIGDIPVGRYWRDLDKLPMKTLSINNKEFRGVESSEVIQCSLEQINELSIELEPWDWSHWKHKDIELQAQLNLLISAEPMSEVGIIQKVASMVNQEDTVYLGNSMPIRHWDLLSKGHTETYASRGVNGIDGQLSTALGLAEPNSKIWILLGDLTTLYDFSGFWVSNYLRDKNIQVNLVVINNFGGQIFDRIFNNPLFKNEHKLEFEALAKMWGWNYIEELSGGSFLAIPAGLNLIEIKIESGQSTKFWEAYDKLW